MINYSKTRHLELLKYSQSLKQKGTHIYDDSPECFFELRKYSIMLINHLHWENREHYFKLIEELLKGPMKFLELRKKHQSIEEVVEYMEEKLILFKPSDKSKGFDDLIDEIVSLFDRFCPEEDITETHELSEERVRSIIQNIFIELKDRYS